MEIDRKELIERALGKVEKILWIGGAEPFQALDDQHKAHTKKLWMIAAVLLVVLNVGFVLLAVFNEAFHYHPAVLLLTVGVPLLVFIDPLRDRKDMAKTAYGVTDRRFVVNRDGGQPVGVPVRTDAVYVEDAGNGCFHLRIGSAAFHLPESRLIRATLQGVDGKKGEQGGLVFYNLSAQSCQDVCHILTQAGIELKGKAIAV
jgi:hypothetical protein